MSSESSSILGYTGFMAQFCMLAMPVCNVFSEVEIAVFLYASFKWKRGPLDNNDFLPTRIARWQVNVLLLLCREIRGVICFHCTKQTHLSVCFLSK